MGIINFKYSPVIGKLWRSDRGFLSGHLLRAPVLLEELAKARLSQDEAIKIFLSEIEARSIGQM